MADETVVTPGAETSTQQTETTDSTATQRPSAANTGEADKDRAGLIAAIQQERANRQRIQDELKAFRTQFEDRNTRLQHALSGENPQNAEEEEIRAAYFKLFPHHKGLTPEKLEKLERLLENADTYESSAAAMWNMRGKSARGELYKQIEAEYGGQLSERQQNRLVSNLVSHLQSNPELHKRYEAGDDEVITEFAKEWIEDFVEPVKRKVQKAELDRQKRVPGGRSTGVAAAGKKPINFNDSKAVEDAMVEDLRSRGVEFGR